MKPIKVGFKCEGCKQEFPAEEACFAKDEQGYYINTPACSRCVKKLNKRGVVLHHPAGVKHIEQKEKS